MTNPHPGHQWEGGGNAFHVRVPPHEVVLVQCGYDDAWTVAVSPADFVACVSAWVAFIRFAYRA